MYYNILRIYIKIFDFDFTIIFFKFKNNKNLTIKNVIII